MKTINFERSHLYCLFRHYVAPYYYNIRDYFFSRQKWLTKQIPKNWQDKDTLFETIIFACIIHFIEEEKCFEVTDWEGSGEDHARVARELRQYYKDIKETLPKLQKQLSAEFDKVPDLLDKNGQLSLNNGLTYQEMYGKVDRVEREIKALTDEIMIWAVKNRGYFWT